MKLLFENKRYILSIFLTTLMVFCTCMSGYADENSAPVFIDGNRAIRSIAENTASGVNIGSAVSAMDADSGDTLTYTLGGTDAGSFSIVSTSGQLQTKAALDAATKSTYTVTITVSDSTLTDTITVTINVTGTSVEPPSVSDGICRVGDLLAPGESCTYPGTNTAFSVNSNGNGQFLFFSSGNRLNIKDTQINNVSYTLVAEKLDSGSWEIKELGATAASPSTTNHAPVFIEGTSATRTVAENTATGVNIGSAVSATDADNDMLTYSLGGTDTSSFSIVSTSGQLQTKAALNAATKATYTVTITVSDGMITDTITVIINVTRTSIVPPPVADGICRVGDMLAPGESCTYPGTNTAFSVNSNGNGQFLFFSSGSRLNIRDTQINNISYTLVAEKLDSGSWEIKELGATAAPPSTTNTAPVFTEGVSTTRSVPENTAAAPPPTTNNAPVFTEDTSTTRTVAENAASGTNIGTAVSATDADNDTLTYTLGGTDAAAFSIVSTSGQLQTNTALDYETQSSYSVSVSVSDGNGGSDSITVTINITDVIETGIPPVADGICRVGDVLAAGESCTYPGTDTAFSVNNNGNGQFLFFSSGSRLNIRDTQINNVSYTLVAEKLNSGSWEIKELGATAAPPPTTNHAPVFTDGASTTRTVAENTATGVNIGTPVSATDADSGDTLTYTLGGTDAVSFDIDGTTGQLKTKATLDAETKSTYTVTITVSDGTLTATIPVTITVTGPGIVPPPIADGICRVGDMLAPGESCTYRGTDTAFSVNSNGNGQFLFFSSGSRLNIRDTQINNVSYTLVAEKLNSGSWEVKELGATAAPPPTTNNAPVFTEGTSATRSVAENTASGVNIGSAVAATDADSGDTLTYTLSGTDADSFRIVSASGQLQTSAALNYETKPSYSVSVSVSDGNGGSDSISVTINVTDVNEGVSNNAPVFTADTSTTRSIVENTASGMNIGTAVSATDADNDTLTYTLGGTDAGSFSIVSTSGQLQTSAALDYEAKSSYSVSVFVSDGNGGSDSISVTITVTDVDETPANNAPTFTDGSSTTRSIAENTASGVNIGSAVAATDADNNTLTYTLGGTDAAAFSIVSTSGQLQTSAALDYETKTAYSLTVSVADGNGGSDSISVTINVTDVNENRAPDVGKPGVSITVPSGVENDEFDVIITFTEPVSGFEQSDVSVTGTAGVTITEWSANTEKTVFTAKMMPTKSGKIILKVDEGVATDAANNPNIASAAQQIEIDITQPDVSFSLDLEELRYTNVVRYTTNGPFKMTITFTEPVSGFEQSDLAVDDDYTYTDFKAVDAKIIDTKTYADTYTVQIIPDPNEDSENVSVYIEAGVATDAAGNPNTSAQSPTIEVEKFRPRVEISVPDADVTTATFTIGITFDGGRSSFKRPLGFEQSDLSLRNNTVGATITDWTDKGGLGVFEVEITVTQSGIVTFGVPENVATDLAGNGNTAAVQKTVTVTLPGSDPPEEPEVDTISPSISFSLDLEELRYTNVVRYTTNGPFKMTITFTEPVSGFEQSDLAVDDDYTYTDFKAIDAKIIDTKTYADTYTVQIIPDPNEDSENVSVYIEAGVATDAAGNPNTSAQSPTVEVEKFRPRVEISVPDADVTTATFTIGITFDGGRSSFKRPLGFEQSDLSLRNNTAGATITDWTDKGGLGAFEVEITVTQSGSVTFGVSENVATDLAGNGNTAAAQKTVTITLTANQGLAPSANDNITDFPSETLLLSNYPNPFNPETWIPYQLAKPADVTLTIYDIRGRVVRTLRLGHQPAGFYQNRSKAAHWDGRNYLGEKVATGVYFYTLKAGDYIATRKLLIRK